MKCCCLDLCSAIEIRSDSTLAEAVQILAQHKILSAPVVDVDAPDHASWIDRYIGVVEFAGIAVWILQQVRILPLNLSFQTTFYLNSFMF